MEDSILFSHIRNGTWLDIKCCYCDTEQSIYTSHRKSRYADEIDYKPKSRLKFVTEFIKHHYKDIQYKLDREKDYSTMWKRQSSFRPTPDCALLREMNHLDKAFKLVDEDDNEYTFNPQDKEFKNLLKQIKSWIKDQ